MNDFEARRAIREDFDHTLWVEAAAGAGKTTELVRRVVGLVATGRARLPGIVLVTFTEKAAGELALRLRAELEVARSRTADPVARERLEQGVRELEAARVGTIHAFCAGLLRERPVEAGLDPRFEVLGEDEEERLFDAAFERWLERVLEDPPEGVRRLLRRPPDAAGRGPVDALREAGRAVAQRRDFDGAWTRPPFDRAAAIDRAVEAIRRLTGPAPARFLADLDRRERTEPRDHDALEVALLDPRRAKGWDGRGPAAEVRAALDALARACEEDLAALLFEELRSLVAAYEDEKRRAGKVDYVDLLLHAKRVLVTDATVRAHLQATITHAFVDEFQDTDPLQADLLLLLVADDPACADPARARPVPGKLFVVGDPKQAIYRFRRADVACYLSLRERLLGEGARLVHLATSFRSDPRIQAAVNAAFAPRMRGGGQASYVALERHRDADERRPALIALPVPRPYGGAAVTVEAIDRSLPEAVGNFVAWLVRDSGWTVSEAGHGAPVALEARHVCLLFRNTRRLRQDVVRPFARALEARGIPHAVVGGRAFHEREEVLALGNALAAIERPDDALAVYATLKGPLFALPDHALFLWKARNGTFDPAHRPDPAPDDPAREALAEVRDALAVLAEARRGRNRRPVAATIGQLLRATRAHVGFAAAQGGDQVLANALRVADLARRFEARGATSFRAFVEAFEEGAERQTATDAPVVEDGTDGVRLMTVHKAKGLEFPVVVLADLTTPHTHARPSRFLDPARRLWAMPLCGCVPCDLSRNAETVLAEDRAESDRIAYVAATRARDVLVVPAVADDRSRSWLEPLHDVLYPADDARAAARPAPGCPAFTGPSVLDPGPSVSRRVAPGLHRVGEVEVVWWEALGDERPWTGGVRRVDLLAEDGDDGTSAARYAAWRLEREGRLRAGAEPSIRASLATEARGAAVEVGIERTDVARAGRPGGARFGSLVHAVLAAVPFDPRGEEIADRVALHGRILGATAEERAAAQAAVAAAVRHPLLRRAAASPDCRREVPVAWRDGERLIEGVADLAFREDEGFTVVDYKTDVDLAGAAARYRAQLAAYVGAVAAATGLPARGTILLV